jgi:hypothetical protein
VPAICSLASADGATLMFVLESRNEPDKIAQMLVETLKKKYSETMTWEAVWTNVGQEGSRREYGFALIGSTAKQQLVVNGYGFYDRRHQSATPQDIVAVQVKGDADRQMKGPLALGNRVPMWLSVTLKRPTLADTLFEIGSWHAPGPSSNPFDMFQLLLPNLTKSGLGVLIGDFNYESASPFNFTTKRGTTAGNHLYDRVYLLKPEEYALGSEVQYLGAAEISDHSATRIVIGRR